MKLSEDTVQVLKNFSGINQSLQFKAGKTLKTISPLKTIFVEATVGEDFPKEFALYDLNKLLAKVSLYKDADLSFDDDKLNISANKKSDYIKYLFPYKHKSTSQYIYFMNFIFVEISQMIFPKDF